MNKTTVFNPSPQATPSLSIINYQLSIIHCQSSIDNYSEGVFLMYENNVIAAKSKSFAIRIIKLYKYLCNEKKEFVLSKQVMRSGTSIGANVREAINAQSKADFVSKMSIALKEAGETQYWLELLFETEYISREQFLSINKDCNEIVKILTSIVKTSKNN